jgi:hypothetical protein
MHVYRFLANTGIPTDYAALIQEIFIRHVKLNFNILETTWNRL